MSKIEEYNKVATAHFEEKKRYDLLKKRSKKDDDKIPYYKEQSNHHKKLFEKYDRLAFKEMLDRKVDIIKFYDEQVSRENTRALRSTRYYHYRLHKNVSVNEKERWAIDLIKLALTRSKSPELSCSFGIDSIVVLYLTRKALVELGRDPSDIQVVWCDTLNEFPEVRLFAKEMEKKWNLNLLIQKPKKPLKKIIKEHGGVDSSYFFTRKGDRTNGRPLSEKCCGTLKHEPMQRAIRENNWDLQINGVRADESTTRLRTCLRDGEYYYSSSEWKAFMCKPLSWWLEEDIWDYVEQENIPYAKMYENNLIQAYPHNLDEMIDLHIDKLKELNIDIEQFGNRQLITTTRKQAIFIKKLGVKMFTPRVGCLACPIPVKYGYLHFIRTYYPKVYNTMIYNLGYGKALLDMIPEETKEEIQFILGIDLNEENAHEYLKDILNAKPCVFDKFN